MQPHWLVPCTGSVRVDLAVHVNFEFYAQLPYIDPDCDQPLLIVSTFYCLTSCQTRGIFEIVLYIMFRARPYLLLY